MRKELFRFIRPSFEKDDKDKDKDKDKKDKDKEKEDKEKEKEDKKEDKKDDKGKKEEKPKDDKKDDKKDKKESGEDAAVDDSMEEAESMIDEGDPSNSDQGDSNATKSSSGGGKDNNEEGSVGDESEVGDRGEEGQDGSKEGSESNGQEDSQEGKGEGQKEVKKDEEDGEINNDKKQTHIHSGTIVICSFPCMGKTEFANSHDDCKYLNSDIFFTTMDGKINKDFPGNYIAKIKWHLVNNRWRYLFVSSHKDVRDAMKRNKIKFTLLYPSKDRLEEVLKICDERGESPFKKELIKEHWDTWITEAMNEKNAYPLPANTFITDELFEKKYKFLAQ